MSWPQAFRACVAVRRRDATDGSQWPLVTGILPSSGREPTVSSMLEHNLLARCLYSRPARYFKCCGWRVDEDQGGVLWPMYHLCE